MFLAAPKKEIKNTKKIEMPTDTPTEFELWDTTADIQRRRGRGSRGRGRRERPN